MGEIGDYKGYMYYFDISGNENFLTNNIFPEKHYYFTRLPNTRVHPTTGI